METGMISRFMVKLWNRILFIMNSFHVPDLAAAYTLWYNIQTFTVYFLMHNFPTLKLLLVSWRF